MATNNDGEDQSLSELTSKRLQTPIIFPFTAYSNNHDLLAVVTNTFDVSVFRIASGQVAYTVRQKSRLVEVTAVGWKPGGSCLGIGWTDATYGIYDGGTGKQIAMVTLKTGGNEELWNLDQLSLPTLSQPPPKKKPEEPELTPEPQQAHTKVDCFGWMSHYHLERHATIRSPIESLTTEDWYDGIENNARNTASAFDLEPKSRALALSDLPRAITTLDVTNVLPQLSSIPSHIGSAAHQKVVANANKFTSQLITDSLFAQSDYADEAVQSLLVCQDDGKISVLLDETVKIGTSGIQGKSFLHAAHATSSSHVILCQQDDMSHHLQVMDLPLPQLGGPVLHVVASNTKRLQTLLDYVIQTLRCIEFDYNLNMIIQSRSMEELGEILEGQEESDPVANLYHLAMTGAFTPQTLKWMNDFLKDSFLKRWEQSLNTLYSNIANHIFINLLPALDRLTIAVTALRGLATLHEGSNKFDCSPDYFTRILTPIDCLRLVAQRMQLVIQTEHRQFRAFHRWLKLQVEIAVAGPGSASALEIEEREAPNLDFSLILPYVASLPNSKLAMHIQREPDMQGECTQAEFFAKSCIRGINYDRAKQLLKNIEALEPGQEMIIKDVEDAASSLKLSALVTSLAGQIRLAQQRITQWQSRMLAKPVIIPLNLEPNSMMSDMALTPLQPTQPFTGGSMTKILAVKANAVTVTAVASAVYAFARRPSTQKPVVRTQRYSIPAGEILDAKWIPHGDNTEYVTLIRAEDGEARLLFHRLVANEGDDDVDTELEGQMLHLFPASNMFRPLRIIVGGRKGRLVCVVFGNRFREWRVLDLEKGLRTIARAGGDEEYDEDAMEMKD